MSDVPSSSSITNVATKTLKPHLRHSNYFLTISTQKRLDPDSQEFVEIAKKYQQGIEQIFSTDKDSPNYFPLHYITFKDSTSAWNSNFIKGFHIDHGIELGPTTNVLHSHHAIFIPHRSLIAINIQKLRNDVKTMINSLFSDNTEIYFNGKFFHSAKDSIENYFEKQTVN